jgi:diguanylate cyclase (GGDEF)-like protein
MDAWSESLRELRIEYVAGAQPKLQEATQLLDHLASDPGDRQALSDLMRRFHGFAGSGTTYGFPAVSENGLEAERECQKSIDAGEALSRPELERLRQLLALIHAQFDTGEPSPAAAAAPHETTQGGREILVIDDDPDVLSMVQSLLEREGMQSRLARTRGEALAQMDLRMPDGMIVDILLPDGSGYDLVSEARARPEGEDTAIVILSMKTGFLDKVEAIHCGADGFFEKPLDWEKLIRRLQHLLDKNRLEASRVLSVEDDPSQAAFLRAVLTSAGYEVRVCADPRRFESDLSSFRPDLVLMDLLLPGVSGHDLVKYLRQDERYATLPVLFLTTEGQVEAQMKTLRAGGDDHLIKPVLPGLLLSAVAGRLERARFLRTLLSRDGQTRLLTHTALLERARELVSRKRRDPERAMAWVMLDLDHFKAVNDRFGHPVGDNVIFTMAAMLRRRLRQTDTLGRYGGEEFAVLLDELAAPEAERLVNRLLQEFRAVEFHAADGTPFRQTFSAGIAMLTPGMDLESWRQTADETLYKAKAAGRNRVLRAS